MKNKFISEISEKKSRIAVLFCGGNVSGVIPCIKAFVRQVFACNPEAEVFGVINGFYGLTRDNSWFVITAETLDSLEECCFGTCREFNPAEHYNEVINGLLCHGVTACAIFGGDGSARGTDAISDIMSESGIKIPWVYFPASIDGVFCTDEAIGQRPAANFIADMAKHLTDNAYSTLDCGKGRRRIAIVECSGRNLDFLMINSFTELLRLNEKKRLFPTKEKLLMITFRNGQSRDMQNIFSIINELGEDENLCIIVHEHAVIKFRGVSVNQDSDAPVAYRMASLIKKECGIKANVAVAGYLAQSNSFVDEESAVLAEGYANKAAELFTEKSFAEFIEKGESLAVVKQNGGFRFISLRELAAANKSEPDEECVRLQEKLAEPYSEYIL